jgi:hypothetical protein
MPSLISFHRINATFIAPADATAVYGTIVYTHHHIRADMNGDVSW